MARVLYLDCFSGISGDMLIGACLDAGLPLADLTRALGTLGRDAANVSARQVQRCGISATKFDVHEDHPHHDHQRRDHDAHPGSSHGHDHPHPHEPSPPRVPDLHGHHAAHGHRSLREIGALIDRSALSLTGRERARALFQRLAEAEAAIHQMAVDEVHLHEVGALDSIVDIVGAVFALEWIGADRVVCSPLNVGGGMVRTAHGLLPVPAPATLRLLGDAPIYGGGVQQELVTPTGALIATSYATAYGPLPAMTVERAGYGAGSRDHLGTPNVLRILVGTTAVETTTERVLVLECEIDDMNPQIFGLVMERLYDAGALDVYYVPVQMKKNRPGTLLTVLSPPDRRSALSDIVFTETTTIGLRCHETERERLPRDVVAVETPLGPVRVKRAWRGGRVVNAAPEFDDCAKLAATHRCSVKEVQALAVQAYGAIGVAAVSSGRPL
jgi:uncharacterized protein (TIGR00299 family) protein